MTSDSEIAGMIVEGNGIPGIGRMMRVSKNTTVKLLEDAGEVLSAYQDRVLRNLPCNQLQFKEVRAFDYCHPSNSADRPGDGGGCDEQALIAGRSGLGHQGS